MSDINFLLHSSTKDQRNYAKEIANDGIITYSLSDTHSDIHANWFKRIFDHINNLTGIKFEKKDTNAEINYSMTISPIKLNTLDDHPGSIKKINKSNFSYIINHKEIQYGGVSSQLEISRTILKSFGLSNPEGDNRFDYTINSTILSYLIHDQIQAGRHISLSRNDQLALQFILGANNAQLETEKYHNTKLNEDLLIGENGRKDYFILNRKGMYTGEDAKYTLDELGVLNNDYLNASVANFNYEEGDKILISSKLFSPFGGGYPTIDEKNQTSEWIKDEGKKIQISLFQSPVGFMTDAEIATEWENAKSASQNLYFNNAGKLMFNVNGTVSGMGPLSRPYSGYGNDHLGAFIDIVDIHYKQLPLDAFEIVDYDWKSISNSYDNKFYKLGDNRFGFGLSKDVVDEITGLESIKFNDKSLHVTDDIKATFDLVTGKDNVTGRMFRLYNAAFARFPDASGLEYWIGKNASGENSNRVVAQSFLGSAEFTEKYGSDVSDETYVNNLYKNVLGRDADAEGLNYWVGNLSSGIETRYEALLGFAESAENKALFSEMTGFV
ncbi:DUF4214 domain-containing protein [Prochlorococcus sp. MIT 0916]|uniref:DUF4214 domain-containing protein n=1 Tax=Prochlorococcus sp. MIT 0916 TaxID=3082521 RepID=UPI0039B4CA07